MTLAFQAVGHRAPVGIKALAAEVLTLCPRCGIEGPKRLLGRHLVADHGMRACEACQAPIFPTKKRGRPATQWCESCRGAQ